MISIILIQWHGARLQSSGEPDHVSFTCHGAPAFNLGSREWSYVAYTWRLVSPDRRKDLRVAPPASRPPARSWAESVG